MLKRMIVERRDRDTAHVTVTPIDTAQRCSHRSRCSEVSFDVRICMERNDEGRMDSERGQLEPPSAGTGFETPGQQCLPNWETGRTTAAGCLPVGVGSNFGGNTFSLAETTVGTRADSEITTPSAASNTIFLQTSCKPKDKKTASEENKQFYPGEKGGEPPPWKAGVPVFFSFLGELWTGMPAACVLCFCLCLSVCYVLFLSGDHFPAN